VDENEGDEVDPDTNDEHADGEVVDEPGEEANGGDGDGDDDDDDDDEEEEEIAFDEEEGAEKELQVEFEFFDPKPDDTPHIRALLQASSLSRAAGLDAAVLAELLAEQAAVGTVIKADGDVFGFFSALSLQHLAPSSPAVARLSSFLLERCHPQSAQQKLSAMLEASAPPVGLIISERLVNAPVQLVPDALDSLTQDIEWAIENEEDKELRASFKFNQLLMVAQVSASRADTSTSAASAVAQGSSSGGGGKKKKHKSHGGAGDGTGLDWAALEQLQFVRPEEEAIAYEAEWCTLLHCGAQQFVLMSLSLPELKAMVPKLRAIMCD